MVELAKQSTNKPIPLSELAKRQGISSKYLEQMATSLKIGGLIESVRGSDGGYRIARPANTISVWDIYCILDVAAVPIDCNNGPCERLEFCSMRTVWKEMSQAISEVLQSWTLEKLAKMETQQQEKFFTKLKN
jgi:Rrf2 family protein